MKKGILVLLACLVLLIGGCSNSDNGGTGDVNNGDALNNNEENLDVNTSPITLSEAIALYEAEGIEVDPEKQPSFLMIYAEDGVQFDIDETTVKIYEYASEEEYQEAVEKFGEVLAGWPKRGLVVIDTESEKALEIFQK